ncbi:HNH endonuclease [Janthinobacterium lividum]|uniref:HNH endonuclease signature motif containing protein n=1 Tax=Janthinobacterium lividum TaxID=29581 RepID=A0ABU0XUB8_9BURK|nr:HNH endonuclease signature motif containing protein [Janthinobacterium lividum]MDQ4627143.1 HNH endonuclease signature motif containing protein [Janthinobacterium lividum]MDQ4675370.1 HNH endonuclease signature motif containing protein [Janthinobacterium lividum]MDQ4686101.1 HNH endonuclease signature motif containing protein [Janthinobacterium lividum]
MTRVLEIAHFLRFNNFYGKPECRTVVYNLYKGVCQSCRTDVKDGVFHVAHIIARTHPHLMEKHFPGLDVDNLLNLQLSCPSCNIRVSNFVLDTPLLLHAFSCSARAISLRLDAVLAQLNKAAKSISIPPYDPRICTEVLCMGVDELTKIATHWHGALVLDSGKLNEFIHCKMTEAFGYTPSSTEVYRAVQESVAYFDDYITKEGRSMEWSGKKKPGWWTKASEQVHDQDTGAILFNALSDGIYLGNNELESRNGFWILLRTEAQRWFSELFRAIAYIRRQVESQVGHPKYVALDECGSRELGGALEKLDYVATNLGNPGRRLLAPTALAYFSTFAGKLQLHGDEQLSDDIKRICLAAGENTIWGDSCVFRRSTLRTWLNKAFYLADLGVQNLRGQEFVRVDDASACRWMPQLPRTKGKTYAQVRLEHEWEEAQRPKRKRQRKGPDDAFPLVLLSPL